MPVRQLDSGIGLPWGDTELTAISAFDYPRIDFAAVYSFMGEQMRRTIEEQTFLSLVGRKYGL